MNAFMVLPEHAFNKHHNYSTLTGGFGSYLFGMSEVIAKQSHEANSAQNMKNPSLGWMIGFLFVVKIFFVIIGWYYFLVF